MFAHLLHLLWLLASRSFSSVSSLHSFLKLLKVTFGGSMFRGGALNQRFMFVSF